MRRLFASILVVMVLSLSIAPSVGAKGYKSNLVVKTAWTTADFSHDCFRGKIVVGVTEVQKHPELSFSTISIFYSCNGTIIFDGSSTTPLQQTNQVSFKLDGARQQAEFEVTNSLDNTDTRHVLVILGLAPVGEIVHDEYDTEPFYGPVNHVLLSRRNANPAGQIIGGYPYGTLQLGSMPESRQKIEKSGSISYSFIFPPK